MGPFGVKVSSLSIPSHDFDSHSLKGKNYFLFRFSTARSSQKAQPEHSGMVSHPPDFSNAQLDESIRSNSTTAMSYDLNHLYLLSPPKALHRTQDSMSVLWPYLVSFCISQPLRLSIPNRLLLTNKINLMNDAFPLHFNMVALKGSSMSF